MAPEGVRYPYKIASSLNLFNVEINVGTKRKVSHKVKIRMIATTPLERSSLNITNLFIGTEGQFTYP